MDTPRRAPDPLDGATDGHILTQGIIDTIHEPLIVLDKELRIVVASRSFYKKFNITPAHTHETKFYDLGNGQWNIPDLRTLLEDVIPKHTVVENYEIEHDFPFLGRRIMSINAREIDSDKEHKKMLLSIFDITDQRVLESERESLILQKDLLLKEMRHRVANSLQLISSILLLKAEMATTPESREHLHDAHERIMSIATVQQQLDPVAHGEEIAVGAYLTALCSSLARTMIGGRKSITIEVHASAGTVLSDVAVSLGLLTTELVINSLKHAFLDGRAGAIIVTFQMKDCNWTLSIADNGSGIKTGRENGHTGLGTSIIGALANQLQAVIRKRSTPKGTTVSIVHTELKHSA